MRIRQLLDLSIFFSNTRFLIVFCFALIIVDLVFFVVFLMFSLALFLLIDSSIDNNNNSSKKKFNKSLSISIVWSIDVESRDFLFVLLLYLIRISIATFFCLFLIYCVTILLIFFYFSSLSIDKSTTSLELLDLTMARRLCRIRSRVSVFLLSFSMHKTFFW